MTGVYNSKAFFPHAASLCQTFVHCRRFSTAASRRSLGSVSVPVWPITRQGRLPIGALVGHYPTNKLIGHGSLRECEAGRSRSPALITEPCDSVMLSGISPPFGRSSVNRIEVIPVSRVGYPCITHPFATLLVPRRKLSRSTCMPKPRRQRSF